MKPSMVVSTMLHALPAAWVAVRRRSAWALLLWVVCGEAALPEGASRVQRFRYDPEASFAILTLPGVPTDLQLASDEHVTGFALGDTIQWLVEELPGHVFVKPLKSDLFTAGTLVTDRRSYQLTLRSGRPRDDWMQRVSWQYPDLVTLRSAPQILPHGAEPVPATGADAQPGSPGLRASAARTAAPFSGAPGVDPSRLDFDYAIHGEGALRPTVIFDDGRTTWIKFHPGQTLPAVFIDDGEGEQLVHFVVRGDWLVFPRLARLWVLRAGHDEVRVRRRSDAGAAPAAPPQEFWR
jgi:type IV secretion system protein VirB9